MASDAKLNPPRVCEESPLETPLSRHCRHDVSTPEATANATKPNGTRRAIPKPMYSRPAVKRMSAAGTALRTLEEYIIPGSPVLATLYIRAMLAKGFTTAEAMFAIYDHLASGRYVGTWLNESPSLELVTEHNPPAGLAVTSGVLHCETKESLWGDVVVTLATPDVSGKVIQRGFEPLEQAKKQADSVTTGPASAKPEKKDKTEQKTKDLLPLIDSLRKAGKTVDAACQLISKRREWEGVEPSSIRTTYYRQSGKAKG